MKEQPMDHLSDELLSEQIDGQLDAATAARVQAHLADCAACAARYAGLQEVHAALQTLRQVPDIPDFRLTQQGKPRRNSPTRAMPPVRRPPAFIGTLAYGISSAALVLGVVLLLVAGFTGLSILPNHQFANGASTEAAAPSMGTGCANQAKCPSTQHPVAGSTSTVAADHPTPTAVIGASSTETQTGTSVGTTSGGSSNPVPVEAGLGLVLVLGGAVGARRFGQQRR